MIIEGGAVLTMDAQDTILDPGWVRVDGHSIVAVSDQALQAAEAEEVIDARGLVVMPGIVNTHTHLFQTLLRAVYDEMPFSTYLGYVYRCGVELSFEDCRSGGVLGGLEALRSGTTTLVDHHFLNRGNDLVEGTITGMLDVGVRSVVTRTVMDIGEGLPDEIKESPRVAFDHVDALLDEYSEQRASGALTLTTGPNTPGINASAEACVASREYVGKRADMALIEMGGAPHMVPVHDLVGHMAHFAKGTDVRSTVVDGRVVMRDRVMVDVDEQALYDSAQQRAAALVERLG